MLEIKDERSISINFTYDEKHLNKLDIADHIKRSHKKWVSVESINKELQSVINNSSCASGDINSELFWKLVEILEVEDDKK